MKLKTKINKWDLIKLKFFHSKGNHTQWRQPTEWEKIYVNEATAKGLIFKINTHLLQLNIKYKPQLISKINTHLLQLNIKYKPQKT